MLYRITINIYLIKNNYHTTKYNSNLNNKLINTNLDNNNLNNFTAIKLNDNKEIYNSNLELNIHNINNNKIKSVNKDLEFEFNTAPKGINY